MLPICLPSLTSSSLRSLGSAACSPHLKVCQVAGGRIPVAVEVRRNSCASPACCNGCVVFRRQLPAVVAAVACRLGRRRLFLKHLQLPSLPADGRRWSAPHRHLCVARKGSGNPRVRKSKLRAVCPGEDLGVAGDLSGTHLGGDHSEKAHEAGSNQNRLEEAK
eukprot:166629-Chlamydomonas_euryale.AAC.2